MPPAAINLSAAALTLPQIHLERYRRMFVHTLTVGAMASMRENSRPETA